MKNILFSSIYRKGKSGTISLQTIALLFISLISGIIISGCSDSDDAVSPTTGSDNISLSVKLSETALDNPLASIQITEAKALISEMEIEATDGMSSEVKLQPFVIYFDLSNGLKEVLSAYIPSKTYRKIKFQIHKPEDNETPPDPEFKEGTSGSQRYSFIIKGTYNGNPFVFKSRNTVNLVINMNGNVNFGGGKINLTMLVNRLMWFLDNGNEIDPRESGNETKIDDNLKNSFKNVFKDDDKNGLPTIINGLIINRLWCNFKDYGNNSNYIFSFGMYCNDRSGFIAIIQRKRPCRPDCGNRRNNHVRRKKNL